MAKVPKVLGDCAPKFSGTQKYGNNNTHEIYTFPKREAYPTLDGAPPDAASHPFEAQDERNITEYRYNHEQS